ncbi:MAG: hypothetical protein KKH04_12550 [Proteobacteria bacterium]|nr:hypothetical protein [Pseudomonadota bacterium]
MIHYFETSAINYAYSRLSINDASATKAFQELRGRKWMFSPVNIWEILLTGDDEQKEKIIHFCQYLFHEELLPSPEELLIAYIQRGCPEIEPAGKLQSSSRLAEIWRDLCANPVKTFIYNKEDLKRRVRIVARVSKDLSRLTKNADVLLSPYGTGIGTDITLEGIVNNLPRVKSGELIEIEKKKLYKIAIFYLMFVLCAELGLDPVPIKKFWRSLGIHKTRDRIKYALENLEMLVHRGPMAQMAYMTLVQTSVKFSRGLFWDCLHSTYLTYVDYFWTEDEHFLAMKQRLSWYPNSYKIFKLSEAKWSFHERENPRAESYIAG